MKKHPTKSPNSSMYSSMSSENSVEDIQLAPRVSLSQSMQSQGISLLGFSFQTGPSSSLVELTKSSEIIDERLKVDGVSNSRTVTEPRLVVARETGSNLQNDEDPVAQNTILSYRIEALDRDQSNAHDHDPEDEYSEEDSDYVADQNIEADIGENENDDHIREDMVVSDGNEDEEAFNPSNSENSSHQTQSTGMQHLRQMLQQNRGSIDNSELLDAMQLFMENFSGSPHTSRYSDLDALVDNLSFRDDPLLLLETISEISDQILMMDGITAERAISSRKLSRSLIDILQDSELDIEFELHVVCCRCLYNLIEVNTDFVNDAIFNGAVKALIHKLLNLVDIELTEQCLQTLEIISRESESHSHIISNNGLKACLEHLDFLTVHSQRKCMQIVANACSKLNETQFEFVKEEFSSLMMVVGSQFDLKVRELSWFAISKVIDNFELNTSALEKLFLHKPVILMFLNAIQDHSVGIDLRATTLVRCLIILSSQSTSISAILLNLDVGSTIEKLLAHFGSSKSHIASSKTPHYSGSALTMESIMSVPGPLLDQTLILIDRLLGILLHTSDHNYDLECTSQGQNHTENASSLTTHYRSFIEKVWPVLVLSFQTTLDQLIRNGVVMSFWKIVTFDSLKNSWSLQNFEALLELLSTVVTSMRKVSEDGGIELMSEVQIYVFTYSCRIIHQILIADQESANCLLEEGILPEIELIHRISMGKKDGFGGDHQIDSSIKPNVSLEGLVLSSTTAGSGSVSDHGFMLNLTLANKQSALKNLFAAVTELESASVQTALTDLQKSESSQWREVLHELNYLQTPGLSSEECSGILLRFSDKLTTTPIKTLSHEIVSLGLIPILLRALKSKSSDTQFRKSFHKVFKRSKDPWILLLQALNAALARSESFEVYSTGNTKDKIVFFAKQLKFKLTAAEDDFDSIIPPLQNLIVSVQAISSVHILENFVKQRIMSQDTTEDINETDRHSNSRTPSFHMSGMAIEPDQTLFGAVFSHKMRVKSSGELNLDGIWDEVHELEVHFEGLRAKADRKNDTNTTFADNGETSRAILELLAETFKLQESCECQGDSQMKQYEQFVNWKITAKVNRQLEEPFIVASGCLPPWVLYITKTFSFLLPLDTRLRFLESTAFGISRMINSWQRRTGPTNLTSGGVGHQDTNTLGIHLRKKFKISRDKILPSALKILAQYSTCSSILEFEFFGEIGSGSGPTSEFYSLVSREFCKAELGLWRNDFGDDSFVNSASGLFPAPLTTWTNPRSSNLALFNAMGKFVARSLMDARIVDLNFSPIFLQLIQRPQCYDQLMNDSGDLALQIDLMRQIDHVFARSMSYLLELLMTLKNGALPDSIEGVLTDLCLTFDSLICQDLVLTDSDLSTPVTSKNLDRYIRCVLKHALSTGIQHQVRAFREGFSVVIPIDSLLIFSASELACLFGNREEDWSCATLFEAVKTNHGYTSDSIPVQLLLSIMSQFDESQRRKFLQFLTGSARLPVGGWKALRPVFTVVKKFPEDGEFVDNYLPSVMTCANYLKLPEYSLAEIMRSKIIHAMNEGADAFHLS